MPIHSIRCIAAMLGGLTLAGCAGADATGPASVSVSVSRVQLTGCPKSASPLPGWVNCTGTVSLTVSKPPSTGYISVYFDYGSTGTFYHGQAAIASGTQAYTVNVVADYVPQCYTSVATSVDVYDGTTSTAPLIVSVPMTLTGSC